MVNSINKNKEQEIEEIQRRIIYLVSTDQISEVEKIIIARDVLNIVEHEKRDRKGEVQ